MTGKRKARLTWAKANVFRMDSELDLKVATEDVQRIEVKIFCNHSPLFSTPTSPTSTCLQSGQGNRHMNPFAKICRSVFSATAMATLLGAAGMASAQNYEASLDRGARADSTPEQRYQSALREAGGGLKLSLAECKNQAAAERKACEAQARANYKQDMEMAREMRKNPDLRPYSVKGGEIRMTGETPVKP